jgi:hypothetical protein
VGAVFQDKVLFVCIRIAAASQPYLEKPEPPHFPDAIDQSKGPFLTDG